MRKIRNTGLALLAFAPEATVEATTITLSTYDRFSPTVTTTSGHLGDTVTNPSASQFDELPIFVWIFDAPAFEDATERALLSIPSRNPGIGDPWYFPVHLGNSLDSATIHLPEFFTIGDCSFTPDVRLEELGSQSQNLTLAPSSPIPEPHGAILLVGGTAILLLKRRRCGRS